MSRLTPFLSGRNRVTCREAQLGPAPDLAHDPPSHWTEGGVSAHVPAPGRRVPTAGVWRAGCEYATVTQPQFSSSSRNFLPHPVSVWEDQVIKAF